ncbi:MAG: hypothetical protein ACXWT1_20035 [Methylobacter sp.]
MQREIFDRRENAIRHYIAGLTTVDIAKQTGVAQNQLATLLKRCLGVHPDGRIFGFRALIAHVRVKTYQRQQTPGALSEYTGNAGLFSQLLEAYPALEEMIRRELHARKVRITREPPNLRLLGIEGLHRRFIHLCRELGLRPNDYPLNTQELGIRSLSAFVKRCIGEDFERAAHYAGATHIKGPASIDPHLSATAVTRPLENVEFDGHLLDIPLQLTIPDPVAGERTVQLERVWLLVVIDVLSRAVLSYHLVLDRQYRAYDVICTVEKALIPHPSHTFTLPGAALPAQGGFPNQIFPELAYATWDCFRFDRAKAHWADDTIRVLCDFIGCIAHSGPPYQPNERPFIERFFGTLTTHFSHRLPGGMKTKLKSLRYPKSGEGLSITLAELEDLLEIMTAHYNGSPHESLNGRTPLEQLAYFLREKHTPLRWLAAPHRRNLCLMQMPRQAIVRGSVGRGVRPYVHFLGVRYSNELLAHLPNLINQPIQVYYHPEDLRTLRAFYPDGNELGTLFAAHPWRETRHSETLRQDIFRQRRAGRLKLRHGDDPITAYIALQQKTAPKSRQAASKLADAKRIRDTAEGVTERPKASDNPHLVDGPVKPKKLPIGSGHVF